MMKLLHVVLLLLATTTLITVMGEETEDEEVDLEALREEWREETPDSWGVGEPSAATDQAPNDVQCTNAEDVLLRCWCAPWMFCAGSEIVDKTICRAYNRQGGKGVIPVAECVPAKEGIRYEILDSGSLTDSPSVKCNPGSQEETVTVVSCGTYSKMMHEHPDVTVQKDVETKTCSADACKQCKVQIHCRYDSNPQPEPDDSVGQFMIIGEEDDDDDK